MYNYMQLARSILNNGSYRMDRTGTGTQALFGTMLTFNQVDRYFPAVTVKKLYFKTLAAELIGFLKGCTNAADFRALGASIWDGNANSEYWQKNPKCKGPDDMGRVYGVQWRDWRGPDGSSIDQLLDVLERIKTNPSDRRLCVTAWNPGELDQMCLPPCHLYFQYFVSGDRFLDMMVVMRSVDTFLGMPFDIASYALLLILSARHTGKIPGTLKMFFGDTHIYSNHIEQVETMLARTPYKSPRLWLSDDVKTIDDFSSTDQVKLIDYEHHPEIKAPLSI